MNIKPCPFCGAKAHLEDCDHPQYECVICDNCGASGPDRRVERGDATELWNERVSDKELIQMLVDVIQDFLPNIGNCALQDYGRLNTALIEADKRLKEDDE